MAKKLTEKEEKKKVKNVLAKAEKKKSDKKREKTCL